MRIVFLLILIGLSNILLGQPDSLSNKEKRKSKKEIRKIERLEVRQAEVDKINALIVSKRWLWEVKTNEDGSPALLGQVIYLLGDIGFMKMGPGKPLKQFRVTSYEIEKKEEFYLLKATLFGEGGAISFILTPDLYRATIYFPNEKGFNGPEERFFNGSEDRTFGGVLMAPEESTYFRK